MNNKSGEFEHFIVVLGSPNNKDIQNEMTKTLESIGNLHCLFDNVYILSTRNTAMQTNDITVRLSTKDGRHVFVTRFKYNLGASWCLPTKETNFMDDIFLTQNFDV